MIYILANNATAQPAGTVTDVATTIELSGASSSLLAALADVDTGVTQMRLTLSDPSETNHEVVEVTAYSASPPTVTVTRAQEDTTAQEWTVNDNISLRLTAGLIEELLSDYLTMSDLEGTGTGSYAIGDVSRAQLDEGIALGYYAWAQLKYAVAIGGYAEARSEGGVAIGYLSKANYSTYGIAVGQESYATGLYSIGIGGYARAQQKYSVVIGYTAYSDDDRATAIGYLARVESSCYAGVAVGADAAVKENAEFGNALGYKSLCYVPHGCHAALLFYNPASGRVQSLASGDIATRQRTAPVLTLASDEIDLLADSPLETYEIDIPSGCHFFPDRIDIIITSADTPGGTPKIIVGTAASPGNDILTEKTITVDTAYARQSETPDSLNGVANIYISVTTAGSGTELKARVLVTGMLVEDEV